MSCASFYFIYHSKCEKLICRYQEVIHVSRLRAVWTVIVMRSTIIRCARAYQAFWAYRQIVGLNARSMPNAVSIAHASIIAVLIHVRVFVAYMQCAVPSIIMPFVVVWMVSLVIHSHAVFQIPYLVSCGRHWKCEKHWWIFEFQWSSIQIDRSYIAIWILI